MCVVVVTIREDYCKLSCRLMHVNFLSLTSSVKRRQSCLFTSLRRHLKRSLVEFVFDKSSCIASSSNAIFSKIRVTLSSALSLEILWRVLPDPFSPRTLDPAIQPPGISPTWPRPELPQVARHFSSDRATTLPFPLFSAVLEKIDL